jgi:hypothetical protein
MKPLKTEGRKVDGQDSGDGRRKGESWAPVLFKLGQRAQLGKPGPAVKSPLSTNKSSENQIKLEEVRKRVVKKIKHDEGPSAVRPAARGKEARGKETRPKGKTYRKAHYDPREVSPGRAQEKLDRRLRLDSKPGGRSNSRYQHKKSQLRLGSDRFNQPYRDRLDRPWSIDEDEGGPNYEES